jgi:hypothetical protein
MIKITKEELIEKIKSQKVTDTQIQIYIFAALENQKDKAFSNLFNVESEKIEKVFETLTVDLANHINRITSPQIAASIMCASLVLNRNRYDLSPTATDLKRIGEDIVRVREKIEDARQSVSNLDAYKPVLFDEWTESERGWGKSSDGISVHLSEDDYKKYIDKYWRREKIKGKGFAPDIYSRQDGCPRWAYITPHIYDEIKKDPRKLNGKRMWAVKVYQVPTGERYIILKS